MARTTKINKKEAEPTLPRWLRVSLMWIAALTLLLGFGSQLKGCWKEMFPEGQPEQSLMKRVEVAREIFSKRDDFPEIGCIGDCSNGFGRVIKIDGTIYEGKFVNDLPHGDGLMVFSENNQSKMDFIVCNFSLGSPSGVGYVKYANGDIYEGEVLDFEKHGKGKYHIHLTGETQQGEWVNDKKKD